MQQVDIRKTNKLEEQRFQMNNLCKHVLKSWRNNPIVSYIFVLERNSLYNETGHHSCMCERRFFHYYVSCEWDCWLLGRIWSHMMELESRSNNNGCGYGWLSQRQTKKRSIHSHLWFIIWTPSIIFRLLISLPQIINIWHRPLIDQVSIYRAALFTTHLARTDVLTLLVSSLGLEQNRPEATVSDNLGIRLLDGFKGQFWGMC